MQPHYVLQLGANQPSAQADLRHLQEHTDGQVQEHCLPGHEGLRVSEQEGVSSLVGHL